MELDAQQIAALTSLNRNTVNRYLIRVRDRIAAICDAQARTARGDDPHAAILPHTADTVNPMTASEGNLLVFGIQSHRDHILTETLTKAVYQKLRRMLRKKHGQTPTTLPPDMCPYDAIVDLNGRWHYRLPPGNGQQNRFTENNGDIEAFLDFARKRLTAVHLNGWDHFYYYLKECEFRFNNRDADLYKLLLKHFREEPMA